MKTFGIGFAIGATRSPAVANAFSTVEQKIKATSGKESLSVVGGGISTLADFAQKHETLTTLVMGAVTGFTVFKVGALAAAYGATFFGASTIALGGTLVKLPSLMRLVGMGAHAMLGPFGLVTSAIALIAGYVVQHWESIGPVVMALWDDLKFVMSTIKQRKNEVERLVSSMVNDAVRLAYGS